MGKYKTIVIDPPWKISPINSVGDHGIISGWKCINELPYKQMGIEELKAFPIDNFADKDCDIFMWVTQTTLPWGLEIIKHWGFKYHAVLTWDKLGGTCLCGFYRRTELVIYGYRGKQGVDKGKGHYIPTLFVERKREHSRKPDIFYDTIRGRTKEPRIDIFARKRHDGFDAWGDEVE